MSSNVIPPIKELLKKRHLLKKKNFRCLFSKPLFLVEYSFKSISNPMVRGGEDGTWAGDFVDFGLFLMQKAGTLFS